MSSRSERISDGGPYQPGALFSTLRGAAAPDLSNCVHYDAEPARRLEYHRLVGDGMQAGFAVEDGVALHFGQRRLRRVVSSRPEAGAYRVEPTADGVRETRLKVYYLGAHGPRAPRQTRRGQAGPGAGSRPNAADVSLLASRRAADRTGRS